MALLPGYFEAYTIDWSIGEKIAYVCLDYLVIGLFIALLALNLHNIWSIVVGQREYKNLPILLFYVFALIAILLRMVWLLTFWIQNDAMLNNIGFTYQMTKLCVGITQDWITFELAIRIRNSKGHTNISPQTKKRLKVAKNILFGLTLLIYVCYVSGLIVSSTFKKNDNMAFHTNFSTVVDALAWLFLAQAIIMVWLVAWLVYETRKAVKREMRSNGIV